MSAPAPSPYAIGLAGRLFKGFPPIMPCRGSCGLDLSAQDSGDGPAAFIILIVGTVIVGAAPVDEVRYSWPVWLHLLVWLPLTVACCVGLVRPYKGLLIALPHRYRRHEFDAG